MGMFGTVVFVLLAILAIVGPRYIAQWGYNEVDRGHYLESPSTRHWLGTTQDGRDLFALTMRGLGKSMIIGLTVALLSTTMSAIVGSFAAYFGGWFERIVAVGDRPAAGAARRSSSSPCCCATSARATASGC